MNKKIIIVICLNLLVAPLLPQDFSCSVNLVDVKNDEIKIGIKVPEILTETSVFYFPKVVPGTYSISDFGRFVTGIAFTDKNGDKLEYKKKDINSYLVYNSRLLDSIIYTVEDTWDAKVRKNKIFYPNGSSFEKDKVFVLNNGAYLGCIEGMENIPYVLRYAVPENMVVTTTLRDYKSPDRNIYCANDYHGLIDSPVMVCEADTASFYVDGAKITVSSYSETGKKMTAEILPDVKRCTRAILDFWGYMPVDHYTFMFYFIDFANEYNDVYENPGLIKLMKHFKEIESGALEHKHSSFYVLLDMANDIKSPIFKDIHYTGFLKEVVVHEFMHTIAPIGLHSKEIGEINYYRPSVSKHLWMYEGITEYFANLIMLQNNMVSMEGFFNHAMKRNVERTEKYPFNKMSMIEMSENVLDKKYNKHYNYVYTYGALLGLFIDIEILRLSEGKTCLKDIIKTLYEKYGYNTSFNDDDFIPEFLNLAPPGLEDFFNRYVKGSVKPDYNEFVNHIGVNYYANDSVAMPGILNTENGIVSYNVKRIPLAVTGELEIGTVADHSLLMEGDKINIFQMDELLLNGMAPLVEDNDTIYLDVKRSDGILQIPFRVKYKENVYSNFFIVDEEPDGISLKLRDAWINKNVY